METYPMYFTILSADKQDAFIKKGTSEAEIPKKPCYIFCLSIDQTAKKAAVNKLTQRNTLKAKL
jgi:hypothetical protein